MNNAALLLRLRELLTVEPGIERVETLAQYESRQREEAQEVPGLLPPIPRSSRSSVPEDVLVVTCTDRSEFGLRLVRLAHADRDDFEEGDPAWKRPKWSSWLLEKLAPGSGGESGLSRREARALKARRQNPPRDPAGAAE